MDLRLLRVLGNIYMAKLLTLVYAANYFCWLCNMRFSLCKIWLFCHTGIATEGQEQ